MVVRQVLKSEI